MASEKTFNADMTMEDIMNRWPQTVGVILRRRMLCVGCPVADFHTPVDAAREHFVEFDALEAELKGAIGGKADEAGAK
jgi:hybrid cluster-associated redox disulfide protein